MFQELTPEQAKKLNKNEIDYAATINIEVLASGRLVSSHTFYDHLEGEVETPAAFEVMVKAISPEKVDFYLKIDEQFAKEVSLASGESYKMSYGEVPYTSECEVKVVEIKAGEVKEL